MSTYNYDKLIPLGNHIYHTPDPESLDSIKNGIKEIIRILDNTTCDDLDFYQLEEITYYTNELVLPNLLSYLSVVELRGKLIDNLELILTGLTRLHLCNADEHITNQVEELIHNYLCIIKLITHYFTSERFSRYLSELMSLFIINQNKNSDLLYKLDKKLVNTGNLLELLFTIPIELDKTSKDYLLLILKSVKKDNSNYFLVQPWIDQVTQYSVSSSANLVVRYLEQWVMNLCIIIDDFIRSHNDLNECLFNSINTETTYLYKSDTVVLVYDNLRMIDELFDISNKYLDIHSIVNYSLQNLDSYYDTDNAIHKLYNCHQLFLQYINDKNYIKAIDLVGIRDPISITDEDLSNKLDNIDKGIDYLLQSIDQSNTIKLTSTKNYDRSYNVITSTGIILDDLLESFMKHDPNDSFINRMICKLKALICKVASVLSGLRDLYDYITKGKLLDDAFNQLQSSYNNLYNSISENIAAKTIEEIYELDQVRIDYNSKMYGDLVSDILGLEKGDQFTQVVAEVYHDCELKLTDLTVVSTISNHAKSIAYSVIDSIENEINSIFNTSNCPPKNYKPDLSFLGFDLRLPKLKLNLPNFNIKLFNCR